MEEDMLRQSLNIDWLFRRGDRRRFFRAQDSEPWQELDLPHDWSIELDRDSEAPCGASGGFFVNGRAWYEKTLTLEADWQGKAVWVEFEGVYMNAEVWLNEHLLGRHPYGYTSFHYDLTPYLAWDKPNTLRVFVDNSHQRNSRWYSGSGIYRPVWLRVGGGVHVPPWGVFVTTPEIATGSARVNVRTRVDNTTAQAQQVTLRTRVIDPDGTEVGLAETSAEITAGSQHEFSQDIQVAEPQLWSPDTPTLYTVQSQVLAADAVSDTESTTFGIRGLQFSTDRGFTLNGATVLLKGGCVHHDNGILGAASYARSEERKVELLKASGFNAVRCAHNPPAPAFLEACDRLGMLVIDEAFDCWREPKTPGDYHVAFDDWWQRDLESMVCRDRNHPSVIIWSIGNEIPERGGRSGGLETSRRLAERVRTLDPTRPVTAAFNYEMTAEDWNPDLNLETVMDVLQAYADAPRRGWARMDASFGTLDICGYNYDWKQYRLDHERVPERIMAGTESFAGQAYDNWQSVMELPYVIGDFVWTSLDYLGESGIGKPLFNTDKREFLGQYPWHQAYCGDLDLCGFKRPQSYYRDTLWNDEPRLYLAVHPPYPEGKEPLAAFWSWPEVWPNWNWSGHEGRIFTVDVYANCDRIELFVNGQSLGSKPCGPEHKNSARFEVPYAPGELRAVGYRDGQPVTEQTLKTTGAPSQLRLTPDRDAIRAGGDLCYVTVEVLDAQGLLHPSAEDEVHLTIEGPGKILAVGTGNPTSEEPYVGDQRRAHHSRVLVVVQSSGEPGEIALRAQANGLASAETKVRSRS
jgi:beta-galactosidase